MEKQRIAKIFLKGFVISLIFCIPLLAIAKDINIGVAGDSVRILGDNLCFGADCRGSWATITGAWNTNGTNVYYNGGLVGIGTSAPAAALDINRTEGFRTLGPVLFGGSLYTGRGNSVLIVDNAGNVIATTTSVAVGLPASSVVSQTLRSNGSSWVADSNLFNTGTNVGVGTTNPLGKLQVSTATDSNWLYLQNSSETGFYTRIYNDGTQSGSTIPFARLSMGHSSYGDNASIHFYRGGDISGGFLAFTTNTDAERMRINAAGNVGIGTTAPSQKLQVAGGAQLDAVSFGVTPGSTQNLALSTVEYVNAKVGGSGGVGTGITGQTLRHNGTGWIANSTLFNNGTNVGIGTTNPTDALTVIGASGVRIHNGGYDSNLVFGANDAWKSGIRVFDNGDAEMRIWHANSLGQIVLATGYNGDEAVAMPTDGLFIDQNKVGIGYTSPAGSTGKLLVNGNVGIGTTAPDANLDIRTGSLVNSTTGYSAHYRNVLTTYINDGGYTGTMKIVLPKASDTMVDVTIKGYDYSSIGAWEVRVSGYLYAGTGGGWYTSNHKVQIIGSAPFKKVRLAWDGSKPIILLGDTATNWTYSTLVVSDFISSFRNVTGWGSGWTASVISSETGITTIATPTIYTYITSTGNLGIGSTAPSQKLHVNGGAQLDAVSFGVTPGSTQTLALSTVEYVNAKVGGSGGVGAGTTGQTLRHNGTGWIANSTLFNNGTNVGIGVTNPSNDLQVGSATFTGAYGSYDNSRVGLLVGNGAGASGMVSLQVSSTYNDPTTPNYGLVLVNGPSTASYDTWGIMHDGPANANGGLKFAYGAQGSNIHTAVPMVTFQKSGNVGIGTTNPVYKLDVGGPTVVRGASDNSAPALDTIKLDGFGLIGNRANLYITNSLATGLIQFGIGGVHNAAPKMTILNSGNVGIGTASPSQKLQVVGGAQLDAVSFGVTPGSTQTLALSTVEYVNAKVGGSGGVGTGITGQTLRHNGTGWIANSTLFNNGTNVGIGTNNPLTRLNVAGKVLTGSLASNNGYNGGISVHNNANEETSLFLWQNGVASGKVGFPANNNNLRIVNTYTDGSINNAAAIDISTVGNVGIGTTAPTQKLDVNGIIKTNGNIMQGNTINRSLVSWSQAGAATGAVVISLPGAAGTNHGMVQMEINVYEYGGNSATTFICGGHNWSTQWYNFSCSSIGVSDKKVRLGVKSGKYVVIIGEQGSVWSYGHVVLSKITNPEFYTSNMDLSGPYTIILDNTAEAYSWVSSDLNRFNARNAYFSGNVGIGTSPAQKLHVAGTTQLDAVSFGITPGSTQTLALSTVEYVNAKVGGSGGVGTGTTGQTLRHNGTGWISDSNLFNNATNVGIGTTAPSQKLQVLGNAYITNQMSVGGNQGLDVQANVTLMSANNASGGSSIYGINYNGGSGSIAVKGYGYLTSGAGTNYGVYGSVDNASSLATTNIGGYFSATATGGTAYALITGAGNVGIGITNPNQLLQVNGASGAAISIKTPWAGGAYGQLRFDTGTGNSSIRSYVPGDSTNGLQFFTYSGGENVKMTILGGGNVGIGSATPSQKLHVTGGAQLDAVSFGVTPGSTQTLALSTVEYVNAKVGGSAGVGTGTTGQTLRHNGTGWIADSTITNNGTNVGVGVVPGAFKLSVAGTGSFTGTVVVAAPTDATHATTKTYVDTADTNKLTAIRNQAAVDINSLGDVFLLYGGSSGSWLNRPPSGHNGSAILHIPTHPGGYYSELWFDTSNNRTYSRSTNAYATSSWMLMPKANLSTANYVTKWLSADSIGNSIVYDNGTNVGIGTTAPSQKLQVAGGAQLDAVSFGVTPGSTQLLAIPTVEYVNAKVGGPAGMPTGASTQTLRHDGTNWVANSTLSNNGTNVGIGTTNPYSPLQVGNYTGGGGYSRGSVATFAGAWNVNTPTLMLLSTDNTLTQDKGAGIGFGVGSESGSTPYTYAQIKGLKEIAGAGYSGYLAFYTTPSGSQTNTERLRINSLGNVGIGTAAPNTKLQVSSVNSEYLPSTANFSIQKNEEGYGLFAGVSGSGNAWLQAGTKIDTTNYHLILQSRGGNVGIGTATTEARLNINQGGYGLPATTGTTQAFAALRMAALSGGNVVLDMGTNGAVGTWLQSTLRIDLSQNYPMLLNPNGGNVGIGLTSTTQKLHVNGGAQLDAVSFGVTPGSTQTLALSTVEYVNSKVGGSAGVGTGTTGQTLRNNGTGWIADSTLFNNGTNVGIGVTNPGHKLVVGASTADAQFITVRGYSNDPVSWKGGAAFGFSSASVIMGQLSGVAQIGGHNANLSGWANLAINSGGGNVGIGTTAPTQRLDVNGGIKQLGYNVGDSATDNLLVNGDFEMNSNFGWSSGTTVTGGISGNYALQITGNVQLTSDDFIPVDPVRDIFQLDALIKKSVAGTTPGVLYFGYIAYDANKAAITSSPCGTYCYFAASGNIVPVDGAWHKYSATTAGEGTSAGNFPVGTKYVKVLGLINYGASGDSVTLLDHVTLKRLPKGPLIAGNNFSGTNMLDQNQYSTLYTSSANHLIITPPGTGNIGIGIATPTQKLHVNGGAQLGAISFGITPGSTQTLALATVEYVNSKSGGSAGVGTGTSGQTLAHNGTGWVASSNIFNNGTNVGIGTVTTAGKLTIGEATGVIAGPNQGSLVFDHENSGGASSIVFRSKVNRGSDYGFIQYQDSATVGGAGETAKLIIGTSNDTNDDVVLMPTGNVGIKKSLPTLALDVVGSINATGVINATSLGIGGSYQTSWDDFLFRTGSATITVDHPFNLPGLFMGNMVFSAATSSISGITKLTVGTIDPLYSINGINYSTFATSMVGGVKEEFVGKAQIITKNKINNEYETVIDFANQEKGSDLWVWRKVIEFNKDSVEVQITPYGKLAQVYYLINGNKLIFRSDKPVEISYRLVAKRFDWTSWPTLATDQSEKASFTIND